MTPRYGPASRSGRGFGPPKRFSAGGALRRVVLEVERSSRHERPERCRPRHVLEGGTSPSRLTSRAALGTPLQALMRGGVHKPPAPPTASSPRNPPRVAQGPVATSRPEGGPRSTLWMGCADLEDSGPACAEMTKVSVGEARSRVNASPCQPPGRDAFSPLPFYPSRPRGQSGGAARRDAEPPAAEPFLAFPTAPPRPRARPRGRAPAPRSRPGPRRTPRRPRRLRPASARGRACRRPAG